MRKINATGPQGRNLLQGIIYNLLVYYSLNDIVKQE